MIWKVLPQKSDDLILQLLLNRKLTSKKAQEKFLNPHVADYQKDFKIPGTPKAVKRIQQAIKEKELIITYGDYDVDGVCGVAVLYLGLKEVGAKVLPYIPHREKEGYGLSRTGLESVKNSGALVVISVDCGIVSIDEAKFAKEIGLDLIITDHHQADKEKPEAFEIVHSTKLCGTAVAWCLIRQLLSRKQSAGLLDLVAIATVADMMPLIGVNRSLVKKGMEVLQGTSRVGLLALFQQMTSSSKQIDSYSIGHYIAPRLNAAGRLEHAIDALRLLCTRDPQKASMLAAKMEEINDRRRLLTQEAVSGAREKITGLPKKIYVLSDEAWAPGIIGLVAGKICEEVKRPVIAISVGPVQSKGSARSVDGINIVEIIRSCSDILLAVGGHPAAAGFTIKTDRLNQFEKRLEELMEKAETPFAEPVLEVEAVVPTKSLTRSLTTKLLEFEPFGLGNPKPILASKNMILSDLRTVGEGKHLKGKADGIDFIAFGLGSVVDLISPGQLTDLAYTLEVDRFNGFEKLQLNVKDLKLV